MVQGVGFRPHVWRLARRHGVTGFVRNTSAGVVVEIEGPAHAVAAFRHALRLDLPPLARVTRVDSRAVPALGEASFRIERSVPSPGEYQPISPDAATCADCLRELFDPDDRRFRYPFLNCTNCGPRYTIIEDLPYDRARTTMRDFVMCGACAAEFDDPADRRFHAQPTACARCGPRLWLTDRTGQERDGDPIQLAAACLGAGEIVAVKSLGGFQLACDATNPEAVARLRRRKLRPAKPFAVMVRDLGVASMLCRLSAAEAAVLGGTARPIVVLGQRAEVPSPLAPEVAPNLRRLGVMLPYTPLHHLLLAAFDRPLVMTSGNVNDEPIAKDNVEALARLAPLADSFLLHDRPIRARYDDTVVQVIDAADRVVRGARGYSPTSIPVDGITGDGLALGAHLKNTFAVAKPGYVLVGPHIGDLSDPLSIAHQQEALATYLRLFRADPVEVACDLHPDYASTRLAEEWLDGTAPGREPVRVQHHHAHVASVMAEHGLRGPLIGVAFDGAGYGTDGTVWGGEFLICDEVDFRRAGHLAPVGLPGGDLCAREGWRMAAAYLTAAGLPTDPPPGLVGAGEGGEDARRWRLVCRLCSSALVPRTTSAGRLFDAVASLLGICHHSTFEGEAALRLEALATPADVAAVTPLRFELVEIGDTTVLEGPSLIRRLVAERSAGRSAVELAAAFHAGLADAVVDTCVRLRGASRFERVALSGGVFQNAVLLTRTSELLRDRGFEVYANRLVPANDGGISLGQALVAASRRAGGHRSTMEMSR
ncbi:MAG: carbamoyltransferase HypF [Candidatus Dormibacteria bacterium]